MKLIFHLGTNNWQTDNEPAPGSGILHEAQHNIMNALPGIKSYSIFPSPEYVTQRDDCRVFKLSHNIPICESAGPVSSYRWHTMTEEEFGAYRKRLENEVYEYMDEIEKKEKTPFSLVIAHHAFLNPLVMRDVIARRVKDGKPQTPICCFLHGTGLKMFVNELSGQNPQEYPYRFHKLLKEEGVFNDIKKSVSVCIANSDALFGQMKQIFPTFPQDRIFTSMPGVNDGLFHPVTLNLDGILESMNLPTWPQGSKVSGKYKKTVMFVGRLADWKRIESLILAAKSYEKKLQDTCTLIIGGGPKNEFEKLTNLAEKSALKHTYFMGPQSQPVLAKLFNVASVGVFPSFEEPFGMVFIECMACGCPVIGANSGGPTTFVSKEVGELVPEPGMSGIEELGKSLDDAVTRAVRENWRQTKGQKCMKMVGERFSAKALTAEMIEKAVQIARA